MEREEVCIVCCEGSLVEALCIERVVYCQLLDPEQEILLTSRGGGGGGKFMEEDKFNGARSRVRCSQRWLPSYLGRRLRATHFSPATM